MNRYKKEPAALFGRFFFYINHIVQYKLMVDQNRLEEI